MNEKKSLLVAFGAVFLLVLAGCKGGDTTSSSLTTPFLGGEGGVEISFLEGNPPAEVTDGSIFPFQAIVSLKNVGEFDIPQNKIRTSIIGFLPSQFQSSDGAKQFTETDLDSKPLASDLTGKKKDAEGNIIEPVETFLAFPSDNKNFEFSADIQGNTVFVFRANACYAYQSKAVSELCVLQNQIDKAPDAICNPTEPKTVFSSASPIQVQSLRETVAGKDKVQFSFEVVHSGTGDVFLDRVGQAIVKVDAAIVKVVAAAAEAAKTPLGDFAIPKAEAITNIDAALSLLAGTTRTEITHATAGAIKLLNDAKSKINVDAPSATDYAAAITALSTGLSGANAKAKLTAAGVDCPKDPAGRRSNEDNVIVTVDTGLNLPVEGVSPVPGYTLKCVGLSDVAGTTAKRSGSIKLVNGKRTITCTLDLPGTRTDFKKPIDIKVDFSYVQSADKEVLVKHLIS